MPVATDVPVIPVPETFPPHPRVFLNTEEIEQLKSDVTQYDWLGEYVETFLADSRKVLAEGVTLPGTGESEETSNVACAKQAAELALAFVLTDDLAFAEGAAEILRAYVPIVPTYEVTVTKGLATSAALSEAGWAMNICLAYDLIFNAGILSDTDKQGIENDVLKLSAEAMRICNHPFRSNWRNRAMAGFATVGFCIGDRDLIDEALNGAYDADGELIRDGFGRQLAEAILADGVYYERTVGYHYAVLENYAHLMEVARHSGVDLWHVEMTSIERDAGADRERVFGDGGAMNIKALYEMPFYYAFSDTSKAAVGNAKADKLHRRWFFEAAWKQFSDPKFAWITHVPNTEAPERIKEPLELIHIVPGMPEGRYDLAENAAPGLTGWHENTCTLLPNGGYTVLREGTDPESTGVLMTYGKYGSGHSHPDKLGIVVCAGGKQVLPEVNHYGYGDEDFLTWNNQTLSHNTVTVDQLAQHPQVDTDYPWITDEDDHPVFGEPVFFHPGVELKAFRARCTTAVDGVTLTRTTALVDGLVVDFFGCDSDTEHQYDYVLHVDGSLTDCSADLSAAEAGPMDKAYGYNHVTDVRRASLAGGCATLSYDVGEGKSMGLSLLSTAGELVAAQGHAQKEEPGMPMLMLRAKGKVAGFAAVMSFRGDAPTVAMLPDLPESICGLELTHADGRKDLVACSVGSESLTLGGQALTGRIALVRLDSDGEVLAVDVAE
jgi:hypothetical protein